MTILDPQELLREDEFDETTEDLEREIAALRQHIAKLEADDIRAWEHKPVMMWLAMRIPVAWQTTITILGIFSTEQKAVDECKEEFDCVGPIELDKFQSDTLWPGAYYPNMENKDTVLPSSKNQLNREKGHR